MCQWLVLAVNQRVYSRRDGASLITRQGRINKTIYFAKDRANFLKQLIKEIRLHAEKCKREGYTPAVRLNGTSDVSWERFVLEMFPNVQFYDYTKITAGSKMG